MTDFANILFSGRCNAACPLCIGRQVDPRRNQDNLDTYPPRGLDALTRLIAEQGIRQVVFSGTDTDPLLYRHASRLLRRLRWELPPGTKFSLHTNGRLALRQMDLLNQFDRACLSLPSFDPATYQEMMGVPGVPDLEAILGGARIPVKLSCLVTEANAGEMRAYLAHARALGIRRAVLRQPFGASLPWEARLPLTELGWQPRPAYRGNAVFDFRGMEVTLWDFEQTASTSLNLFSSGEISRDYLLV